ncbi:hypothetical protein [Bifidobacterium eulemuris]|uniref:Uncharacterized protein n=1 Tax=Bifidobacterium eulemuris TaxID=1765219 RepID=A0A261G9Y4_9BIFI|nr:hypothetical protein [Bifidobacterium eulemuris]OZG68229.1 hypothetical protein BEUL_1242 [Bifidobacterium eulemuris]QOL31714.1 hypothetical protein BE0216_03980 [Bifidobacterium eulemuris]
MGENWTIAAKVAVVVVFIQALVLSVVGGYLLAEASVRPAQTMGVHSTVVDGVEYTCLTVEEPNFKWQDNSVAAMSCTPDGILEGDER